ncbi:hypothetical protein RD792_007451 [Penstemon davidsonii]|uniref:Phytocyanin domain-containing protein n=1 Tax=Penstemon davidsonii TaxID=160366 RepID=A0ABR0D7I2_9LAMI|nr:hypothetical protein RD792_007451 [Penstemon davidsonii]
MSMNLGFAVDYSVGGPNGGWTQGIDYQTWASSITFLVGDNLIFQHSLNHDVTEVSKADFESCSANNPLRAPLNGGTTTIPLTTPGSRYFICGTAGHCPTGMKVQIDTIAPPPPTIPPPVPRPPPAIPPTVTPPPPATTPSIPSPPPAVAPSVPLPPPTPSVPSPPPAVAPSVPLPPPTPSVSRPISPSPLKSVAPTPSPASSRLPAAPNALPPSNVPHTLSPTVAQSPSTSLLAPPPSTANKVNAMFGLASGFGSILIMFLNF